MTEQEHQKELTAARNAAFSEGVRAGELESKLDAERKDHAETIKEANHCDLVRREQLLELCQLAANGLRYHPSQQMLKAIYEKAHKYASKVATWERGEHSA